MSCSAARAVNTTGISDDVMPELPIIISTVYVTVIGVIIIVIGVIIIVIGVIIIVIEENNNFKDHQISLIINLMVAICYMECYQCTELYCWSG